MEHSAEEAQKRYESLPTEVKSLLYSPEMSFIVQQIGQKNRLHIDQIDSLNTELGQVLLGFVETKNLAKELVETLQINGEQANAIVSDADAMLFSKIRESMKQAYEMEKEAPSTSASMPADVSPEPRPITPASQIPPSAEPAANPISITKPETPTPAAPPIAPVSKPAPTPDMHTADMMLSEKTVHMAPSAPSATPTTEPKVAPTASLPTSPQQKPASAQPEPYKADPYREPPE